MVSQTQDHCPLCGRFLGATHTCPATNPESGGTNLLAIEDQGITDEYGTTRHFRGLGELHRDDGGPAVVWADGTRQWWQEGRMHRTEGPAVVHDDGTDEWWVRGRPAGRDQVAELRDAIRDANDPA